MVFGAVILPCWSAPFFLVFFFPQFYFSLSSVIILLWFETGDIEGFPSWLFVDLFLCPLVGGIQFFFSPSPGRTTLTTVGGFEQTSLLSHHLFFRLSLLLQYSPIFPPNSRWVSILFLLFWSLLYAITCTCLALISAIHCQVIRAGSGWAFSPCLLPSSFFLYSSSDLSLSHLLSLPVYFSSFSPFCFLSFVYQLLLFLSTLAWAESHPGVKLLTICSPCLASTAGSCAILFTPTWPPW